MKWIGLTGGLGSGKSTVAKILRAKGWPVIDADRLAHEVLAPGSPGLHEVLMVFGQDLLQSDGHLDRRELGQRVFGNPIQLSRLEAIVHPRVQEMVRTQRMQLEQAGMRMAFYDVPLLYEKKLDGFDAIVVVTSNPSTIRARLKTRNQWSDQEIDERLARQIPLSEKESRADFVIRNEGTIESLDAAVDEFLNLLKTKAC